MPRGWRRQSSSVHTIPTIGAPQSGSLSASKVLDKNAQPGDLWEGPVDPPVGGRPALPVDRPLAKDRARMFAPVFTSVPAPLVEVAPCSHTRWAASWRPGAGGRAG